MISVKKNIDFLVTPEQTLSAMGQPGTARAQPLYMCVLDKQVMFVNKNLRLYTLSIQIFFSTLPPKEFIHVKLRNLRFEPGRLNLPV